MKIIEDLLNIGKASIHWIVKLASIHPKIDAIAGLEKYGTESSEMEGRRVERGAWHSPGETSVLRTSLFGCLLSVEVYFPLADYVFVFEDEVYSTFSDSIFVWTWAPEGEGTQIIAVFIRMSPQ